MIRRRALHRASLARRVLARDLLRSSAGQQILAAQSRDLTADEAHVVAELEQRRGELERSSRTFSFSVDDASAGFWQDRARTEPGVELEAGTVTRRVSEATLRTSKPRLWCEFLFKLCRDLEPEHVVEMGASMGVSGSYQAAALKMNGHGSLTTIDRWDSIAAVARDTFASLDLDATVRVGDFDDVLPDVLQAGVGVAFVDGNHQRDATLRYAAMIAPHLEPPGVVLYDDIEWSDGMVEAWRSIKAGAHSAADLGGVGVTVSEAARVRGGREAGTRGSPRRGAAAGAGKNLRAPGG